MDTKTFNINTDRLTKGDLAAFAAGVILFLVMGGYIWHLHAQNSRLAYEKKIAEQKRAALEDSLRNVGSYEDATGQSRNLLAILNHPTRRPDTLGQGRVQGDVKQKTEATIDPKEASGANQTAADTTTKNDHRFLTYDLDEEIGRYRLYGTARVSLRTGLLDYDLAIDGDPIELSIYQARREGQMQSVIDVPSAVGVESLRGYSKPEPVSEFEQWRVQFPAATLRPGPDGLFFGLGGSVTVRTKLPFGAVGYVGGELYSSPTYPNVNLSPAANAGLEWNF